jgi:hypothetical protein
VIWIARQPENPVPLVKGVVELVLLGNVGLLVKPVGLLLLKL